MNTFVFILAGVFVVAGGALIVLYFFAARIRKNETAEGPVGKGPAAETAVEATAEPQGKLTPGEQATATLPDPQELIDRLREYPAPSADTGRSRSYDLRVTLGFRFFREGMFEDGVVQFQKAAALTGSEEDLVKLYMEIGSSLRDVGMLDPARAAYFQADEYTDNPELIELLARAVQEMAEQDSWDGGSDDNGRSGKTGLRKEE